MSGLDNNLLNARGKLKIQISTCNFKKSYWRDNGAPDNSNSTELKLKDETEVKFRDSIYESVRTEIQQYDRIKLSHWTGVTENDDTGVKGLETEFRRANAEQHIFKQNFGMERTT